MFLQGRKLKYYAQGLYNPDSPLMKRKRQKNRSMTDKSAEIRTYIIKDYVIPLWGKIAVNKLTAKMIDDSLVNLVSIRDGKNLSGTVKNLILNILDDLYSVVIGDGLVKFSPASTVIKFSRKITNFRDAIPKDEMDRLFPKSHLARRNSTPAHGTCNRGNDETLPTR